MNDYIDLAIILYLLGIGILICCFFLGLGIGMGKLIAMGACL